MTRINLVEPKELSDQHLLAEMRELPRIFSHVKKYGVNKSKIPEKFCLGTGHVLFFTDKLEFLRCRYIILYKEWINRGFKFNYSNKLIFSYWKNFQHYYEQINWKPSKVEIQLSKQRIQEKLEAKPDFYKWSGGKR